MNEIWKPVVGYEGLYEVSSLGRVKSLPKSSWNSKCIANRKERIRKMASTQANGYYQKIFVKQSIKSTIYIHRIVAMAFIHNPEHKPFVNHINGIKTDNRVENLEWVTSSENILHAISIGLQKVRIGKDHSMAKFTESEILKIRERYKSGESSWKIFKDIGGSYTNIKDIISKRTWSHI